MLLQRPLMKKKPKIPQNVSKANQKTESTNHSHAARILTLKTQTILEQSISEGKVTYRKFLHNFSQYTKKDFETELLNVQQTDPDFSLDNIVNKLSFFGHLCTLQRGIQDDTFVFTPSNAHVQPAKNVLDNQISVARTIPQNHIPVVTRPPIGSSSENSSRSQNGNSRQTNKKKALDSAPLKEILEKHQEYSRRLFCKPSWPWLNEMHRGQNRQKFLKFLQSTEHGSNYQQVFFEAKHLTAELWQSTVPNFPHTLYLLHLVAKQNPSGFELLDFESIMNKVVPQAWREMNISWEDIISEPSRLILQNLVISSGPNDSGLVEVNQLINHVGFYEIWDREHSMIYFFLRSTPELKSAESVHEFMSKNCPKWSDFYDKRTGADRVDRVCSENIKMFRTENKLHTTRSHMYRIEVPMFFPSTPIITRYQS